MDISSNIRNSFVNYYPRWDRSGHAVQSRQDAGNPTKPEKVTAPTECQTCKNRKYVDGSNDASVSYKTPTRIAPGESFSAVRAHEQEHVVNETAKAAQNGGRVVSQTVAVHYAVCPECGRLYAAGGTTTTVTQYTTDSGSNRNSGKDASSGLIIDARV